MKRVSIVLGEESLSKVQRHIAARAIGGETVTLSDVIGEAVAFYVEERKTADLRALKEFSDDLRGFKRCFNEEGEGNG